MSGQQRLVTGLTGLSVAVLAGVFCFLSWDRANQVAGIVSALVSVLALGIGLLALLSGRDGSVRVANTGPATAVQAHRPTPDSPLKAALPGVWKSTAQRRHVPRTVAARTPATTDAEATTC